MCCYLFANSQDLLLFKTGEELKTKVVEVGISEVKYKKFDNLDGATHVCLKADLFMIKYENGTKDVFANLSKPTPIDTNKATIYSPARDKDLGTGSIVFGVILGIVGVGCIVGFAINLSDAHPDATKTIACGVAGFTLTGISIPLFINGAVRRGRANKYLIQKQLLRDK